MRLTAESEEELKSLLMKVKEESEKVGLEHLQARILEWVAISSPLFPLNNIKYHPNNLYLYTATELKKYFYSIILLILTAT